MATAWVRQVQKKSKTVKNPSWYVFWKEPDGRLRKKSFGPGTDNKRLAEMRAAELNAQLKLGTYHDVQPTTWAEFLEDYKAGHLARLSKKSKTDVSESLETVDRILKVKNRKLKDISSRDVEKFIMARSQEPGKKPKSVVSPATVNKDLRNLRTFLNKARKLGHIKETPVIELLKVPEKLKPFITESHFKDIWDACEIAEKPVDHPNPAEWWRTLMIMDMFTGWRIGELLSLEWRDVNLDEGFVITRASANKGKRDGVVWLHPIARDNLRSIRVSADPRERVFTWNHHRRTLDVEFSRIQKKASIHLDCHIETDHECTEACHLYGFHDGRRAFATMNAANMSREALRILMRHQSEETTKGYINYVQQIKPAAQNLHVPEFLRITTQEENSNEKTG